MTTQQSSHPGPLRGMTSPFCLTLVAETTCRGALLGRSLASSTVTLAK